PRRGKFLLTPEEADAAYRAAEARAANAEAARQAEAEARQAEAEARRQAEAELEKLRAENARLKRKPSKKRSK
ncbi:MAG: hypothetical protein ACREAB_21425, partial [Blastocatellia bacterium]